MLTDEPDLATDAAATDDPGSAAVAGTGSLPPWAEPPRPPADDLPPPVALGVAIRLVLMGGVAAVLVLLGHVVGALVLLVVLAVSSTLALTVPRVGMAIDRFTARFQVLAGRGLSAVLLGLFHLVVFVPASLVLRLIRRDPLAMGASAGDPSFWRPAARHPRRSLHRRPFTYERHPDALATGGRVRAATGLVAIVALLDVGIGSQVNEDPVALAAAEDFVVPVPEDAAAGEREPWRDELFDEISASYREVTYHPYRGWTGPDVDGEHLNVTAGVRRSYAGVAGGSDPIDVHFFGGSAMMGWYQRDQHTIASEVVRLAEADGIHVRAVNHGQAGYSIWQELQLLQGAVARGEVPDLAVFYDGANEIVGQFRAEGATEAPTHLQARLTEADLQAASRGDDRPGWRRMLDGWADTSAAAELWRQARGADEQQVAQQLEILWPNPREQGAARGEAAARLHGQAVDLIRTISEGHGFRSTFFWQPWIYSKDILPGEEGALGSWGTDPVTWTSATNAALDELHDGVVDLSDVLDGSSEPVMYDFVHTNEAGAEIVARAIYQRIRPQLLALAGNGPERAP